MKTEIIVVGIGHPARGDDSLGPKVIELLDELLSHEIKRLTISGDLTHLLDTFTQFDNVIIIDAIHSRLHPDGTLLRFEGEQIKQLPKQSHTSTHAFDITQAIQLAANLGSLPNKLVIFGIESSQFEVGQSMSHVVQMQIPKLIDEVIKEIKNA